MFQQLYSNIAVRFNCCFWQVVFLFQFGIIVQHTIMSKSKCFYLTVPFKRVIVIVVFLASLCCHSGMSNYSFCVSRKVQLHLMSWFCILKCHNVSLISIADSCCICSTYFCSNRKISNQLFQDCIADFPFVIQIAKYCTHFIVPPLFERPHLHKVAALSDTELILAL